ncbi:DUF6286 domain-containing protein [Streptomyces sp. NPDC049954]|uniref:DUF6286 domain-containing protein n=1 Tax=Streptomyces sp. NPDC049954 TaxID=3155779 RepID=UPI003439F072
MSEPEGATRVPSVLEKREAEREEPPPPPGSGRPAPLPDPDAPPTARAGRFWSARRVPAGIVSLLILAAAALFLYDVVAVRTGHPAMQWRRTLSEELATRPLKDNWVLVGAGVAAALGLWLLVLALTPGCRRLLAMRRPYPGVRGALHRDAAGSILRDRAMQVAGVQSVKVKARRRKAKVRAVAHFRDTDEVRTELTQALGSATTELGLARTPRPVVRVRRPGKD